MQRIRIPRIDIDKHRPCKHGRLRGALYLDETGEFVDIWWTDKTCYLTEADVNWLYSNGLIDHKTADSISSAAYFYREQRRRILGHIDPEHFNPRMLRNHDLRGCYLLALENVSLKGSTLWDEQLTEIPNSVDTTGVIVVPCPWRKYEP